jgi:hypothetical protein
VTVTRWRRSDEGRENGSGWHRSSSRSADGTEGRLELRQRSRKMKWRSVGLSLRFAAPCRVVQQLLKQLVAGAEVGLAQARKRDSEICEAML